jgi:hypothetical protein
MEHQNWEYWIDTRPYDQLNSAFKNIGESGWELVTVTTNAAGFTYFFKRPKIDKSVGGQAISKGKKQ